MKNLIRLLTGLPANLSPYPIAEGVEEYRVKREILSSIRNRDSRTTPATERGRGSLRENCRLANA